MWNDLLVVFVFSLLFSVSLVGEKPADQEDDETKDEGEGDKARYKNEMTHKHLLVKMGPFAKETISFIHYTLFIWGGAIENFRP